MEVIKGKDRIIVALDGNSLEMVEKHVKDLTPHVGFFKVGLELMSSVGGPQVVKLIHEVGGKVFYDGKFNDISNTIAGASKAVAGLGVEMFDIHASSSKESMIKAVKNKGTSKVLAVTVLTSIDNNEAMSIFGAPLEDKVYQMALNASSCGIDGIVCSPKELGMLKNNSSLANLLTVCPGIRPKWAIANDQKRVTTPYDAIMAGADYLVIGRPILNPPAEIGTPVEAAKRIAEEIEQAIKELRK